MSHDSREEMLHKIRTGLGKGRESARADAVPVAHPQSEDRHAADGIKESVDLKLDRFMTALGGINTTCCLLSNENQVEEYIVTYLHQRNISSFAIWETGLLKDLGIKGALEGRGASSKDPGIKDEIALAGIGITGADYAIAETGTLVLLTGGDRPRGASLLPPIHMAVVKEKNIVNNIEELFVILKQEYSTADGTPSCATFITGPSRTADIELNLTLGVHGPKELHVVIVP